MPGDASQWDLPPGGIYFPARPWCCWPRVRLRPPYPGANQAAMDFGLLRRCFLQPEMKERKNGGKRANLMLAGSITLEPRWEWSRTPERHTPSPQVWPCGSRTGGSGICGTGAGCRHSPGVGRAARKGRAPLPCSRASVSPLSNATVGDVSCIPR